MEESNIIAIRKIDTEKANKAFSSLMMKTEAILNDKAKTNIKFYKSLSSSALENVSLTEIQNACADTPFNPENVELVSGQNFPDIIAEKYFGVEVKSTKYNHWTSTGSSIIESTRDKNVQNIYMLFGKLGGEIAEFKCRPYQDVLSEITVTHSPRYLINMNLTGETIFDKMGTTYDELRTSEDSINQVRNYYRNKSNKNDQMPWWISDNDSEPINMNLRLWATLPENESILITAQMAVLFPEIMDPSSRKDKYYRPALWLAACKSIVCHNFRDSFTAGGKIARRNGSTLAKPLPHIYYTLHKIYPRVKHFLLDNYESISDYVSEYNPELHDSKDKIKTWTNQIQNIMKPKSYDVDLMDFIENTTSLELTK